MENRTFARSIPEADFYIVKDVERNHIVASGTKTEMREKAIAYNEIYQSSAYQVEAWISHNKKED